MKRRGLLLIVLIACSQSVLAWGPRGHELVGQIAENRLAKTSPAALKTALRLLRASNKQVAPGEKECEPTESPRSFAKVANVPDEFRRVELALVTRDWHFVNIEITHPTYDQERDCANGDCVVRRIERMVEILGDDTRGNCDRESALIYLIHFVGDLHQPFHTGFGRLPDGDPDLGGNRISVIFGKEKDGKDRVMKLHGVWDGGFINATNRSSAKWIRHLETTVLDGRDPEKLAGGSVVDWTNESHRLRIDFHLENKKPPMKLSDEYIEKGTAVVEERLLLAGLRLARLIEEALGDNSN